MTGSLDSYFGALCRLCDQVSKKGSNERKRILREAKGLPPVEKATLKHAIKILDLPDAKENYETTHGLLRGEFGRQMQDLFTDFFLRCGEKTRKTDYLINSCHPGYPTWSGTHYWAENPKKCVVFIIQEREKATDRINKLIYKLRPFLRVANSKTPLERSKIAPGFHRCQNCGEYNGTTKAKHLCQELSVLDPEKAISVGCLCKGIPCPQCGWRLVHRPISNSYDAATNSIGHWPWFSGMIPCYECKKGKGECVGESDARESAAKNYDAIIKDYEQRYPLRRHYRARKKA